MNKISIMEASVRKWNRIIAGKGSDGGVLDCPPCRIFYMLICVGCPIAQYTGEKFCKGSPHIDWYWHQVNFFVGSPWPAMVLELIALALVMALLLTVIMIRRHGWLVWRELMVARPLPTVLVILLAVALAQVPVFTLNLSRDYPPFGTAIVFDTDGIIGAAANLVRYLFISVDPTEAVREALVWLIGMDLNRLMTGLYNTLVISLFGRSGASAPFVPVFSGSGHVGFGPFAALLVLPAMVHAALRGPRRLKALSVAWAGYLYLAALVISWATDNLVVLTPLYTANGFMVAFSLPPWRLRRRGMRLLQVLFALLLAGSLFWQGHLLP